MPSAQDTAYPRLKTNLSQKELDAIYTPTVEEQDLAAQFTKGKVATIGFLVLLKVFQRLGYAVLLTEVPTTIIRHVATVSRLSVSSTDLRGCDVSATRQRHVRVIREYLNLQPYQTAAQQTAQAAMEFAVMSKHDLVDLVNIAIEELVRQRYELPGFTTLERLARRVRSAANKSLFTQIANHLTASEQAAIEALFQLAEDSPTSSWNNLKQDPGKPSVMHLQALVNHLEWLKPLQVSTTILLDLPEVKLKHFAEEAMQLDAGRMKRLERHKRLTLATILLKTQYARTLDDLSEMFIRLMQQLHQKGQEALAMYRLENQFTMDALITTLHDVVLAYDSEGTLAQRFRAIAKVIGERTQTILEQCDALLNYTDHNYYSFLQDFYKGQRAVLFRLLESLPVRSSTQEQAIAASIQFLQDHRDTRGAMLSTVFIEDGEAKRLNLDWIPQKWWYLVTGQRTKAPYPTAIYRRHFEMCVFSQIMVELKSGDLYVEGSHEYGDYYGQLLDWQTCQKGLKEYGLQVSLPTEPPALIEHTQQWLSHIAQQTDQRFPDNVDVDFHNNRLVIRKAKKKEPKGLV